MKAKERRKVTAVGEESEKSEKVAEAAKQTQ